jgi:hypothetical protein
MIVSDPRGLIGEKKTEGGKFCETVPLKDRRPLLSTKHSLLWILAKHIFFLLRGFFSVQNLSKNIYIVPWVYLA